MEGKLSKNNFEILAEFALQNPSFSVRRAEERTSRSVEEIARAVSELTERGYVADGEITEAGLEALEPYRAKRAIFLAAGFGSRMVPVTLDTPKPLVRVNGKRIIDGLIDACLGAGIEEIYIIRGYLGEKFDELLEKYPMIKFIENPLYDKANNISSALLARELLQNAYVFEADLLLANPEIVTKYHCGSDFLAIPMDKTDDWCFEVEDGIVVKEKVGGENCWQMVGISYWSAEDGAKLCEDIAREYESEGGHDRYWEQVPLVFFKDRYKVAVRECRAEDIVEIDTFDELCQLDPSYKEYGKK